MRWHLQIIAGNANTIAAKLGLTAPWGGRRVSNECTTRWLRHMPFSEPSVKSHRCEKRWKKKANVAASRVRKNTGRWRAAIRAAVFVSTLLQFKLSCN